MNKYAGWNDHAGRIFFDYTINEQDVIIVQVRLTKAFNASSFCSDKTFFVLDKTEIVQDKNFVHGQKVHFLLSKVI